MNNVIEIPKDVNKLIKQEDRDKIEEYLSYLKCSKCNSIMIDPKNCPTCNICICNLCQQKLSCGHQLVQSRHLKSILDNIKLGCKYPRCKISVKYLEIRDHLMVCPNFDEKIWKGEEKDLVKKVEPKEINNANLINLFNRSSNIPSKVICQSCHKSVNSQQEYLEHVKKCSTSTDISLIEFIENFTLLQKKYFELNSEKFASNIVQMNKYIKEKNSQLLEKKNNISKLENLRQKFSNEDYTDQELENLELEYNKVFSERTKLSELIITKQNEKNKIISNHENLLQTELAMYREKLLTLEIEENWMKNDKNIMSIINNSDCSQCGDKQVNKYFCNKCQSGYCLNKCVKNCQNANCQKDSKYICPKDGIKCSLCRKQKYCESCMIKCFFIDCKNLFCPECYKNNEHQTRNQNTNCRFFTCDNDKHGDCLMTSIYCNKCEKRLCNKCLHNDISHHPFLLK